MTDSPRPEPLLLTVDDAGRVLGVCRATAWKLIAAGELESRKIGRRRLVTAESVRRVAAEGAATAAE